MWMLVYIISFILIVGFFVINMFVGVVVENFHRCREEHELEEVKRKQVALNFSSEACFLVVACSKNLWLIYLHFCFLFNFQERKMRKMARLERKRMSGRGRRSGSRRKYEMLGVVRRKCANALKNAKNSYSTCFRGE